MEDYIKIMKKQIILVLSLLLFQTSIFCHPHLFIDSKEEIVFENGKVQGLWLEWTFDEYFSSEQQFYYDWDQNNYYDEKETEALYNNVFINLKHYKFFTFIRQGRVRTYPDKVHNFKARQENGNLIYTFYIYLSTLEGNEFYLSLYDFTFFCAIETSIKNVKLTFDENTMNVTCDMEQNKEYPVYYDPYGSLDDDTVYEKWRPGLEVFYPYEIHIKYENK